MSSSRIPLAVIALAATVASQSGNEYRIYSGVTSFPSRATLPGPSSGDVCQHFPSDLFACLGQHQDATTSRLVCRITSLDVVIQDQRGTTSELFTLAVIGADPANPGRPDPSPTTGDLLRVGPLTMPTTTSTGAVAWIWRTTLATPFDTLPSTGAVFFAAGLPANANWTRDGVSVHSSQWGLATSNGDDPYLGAGPVPDLVSSIDRSLATPTVTGSSARVMRISAYGPGAFVRIGADVAPASQLIGLPYPNFGVGGLYPNHHAPRFDGLAFLVEDANSVGRSIVLIGSFGGFAPASTVGRGFVGDLCLAPSAILPVAFASGVAGGIGIFQQTFPWPSNWGRAIGRMSFQALTLDSMTGLLHFSNGSGFHSR